MTYEESLKDVLEGKKQKYVDPAYLPEDPLKGPPPEYDEDEGIDYSLDDEDRIDVIL